MSLLVAEGDKAGAEAVLEAPVEVAEVFAAPAFVQAPAPVQIAGKNARINWTAGVEGWVPNQKDQPMNHPGWKNFRLLVESVAAGKTPLNALLPNEPFISQLGRTLKQGFDMPGCKAGEERKVSFR